LAAISGLAVCAALARAGPVGSGIVTRDAVRDDDLSACNATEAFVALHYSMCSLFRRLSWPG
jgi:hypothetical protein